MAFEEGLEGNLCEEVSFLYILPMFLNDILSKIVARLPLLRRLTSTDRADPRHSLGAAGEHLAAKYLKKQRYRILKRNYLCARGEIDIIALDGQTICFVEVKTRRPGGILPPERSVTAVKRRKIRTIARHYILENRLQDRICRYDIISIILPENAKPQLEHFKHSF